MPVIPTSPASVAKGYGRRRPKLEKRRRAFLLIPPEICFVFNSLGGMICNPSKNSYYLEIEYY